MSRKSEITKKFKEKIKKLKKHNNFYYNEDQPVISDEQYDNLNEAYLQENMKRYILDPETLLVKKEILEKIFKDNYFHQISDQTDANIKTHSEYNSIPNLSINYNYKNPFINFENY